MERELNIRFTCNSFILYQSEIFENHNHPYVARQYDVRILMHNQNEIDWLKKSDYYYKRKDIEYVPSKELLLNEYEKIMQEEKEDGYYLNYRYDIYFHKNTTLEKIQSFYDFCLEIEISEMRLKFQTSQAYVDAIYLKVPWKKEELELRQKMTTLFGNPKVVPENEHEKYGGIPDYIIPISKIDKIIGIKKYRDKTYIEDSYNRHYTGQEEEIILDLHDFDFDIYQTFEKHNMLTEYVDDGCAYRNRYEKRTSNT